MLILPRPSRWLAQPYLLCRGELWVHDCLRRLAFKALRELSDLQPGDLDPQYTNGTSFRVRRAYSSNAVP